MAGILWAYSLLASTLLIVIWTVYKCALANTGFFRFNRIILLSSIAIAFILPIFILHPFWMIGMVENDVDINSSQISIIYIADSVSKNVTPVWD